jgi:hypothetical protein
MTETGAIMVTAAYLSPEQAQGHSVSASSDLYSVGILLYELLTRRHPFTRRGDLAALSTWTAVLNEPPLPFQAEEIDRLPPGLPDVIARCLEKEPGRRWSSPEDLEAALQSIHSGGRLPVRIAPPHQAVMWWQFHESAAAVVYWLMLIPVWRVRPWIGRTEVPFGSATLVLDARTLVLVLISTVAVLSVLRFSFVFVSRNKPSQVREHHARAIRWVKAGDLVFAASLVAAGVTISADHQGWALLLVSLGLGSFVSAWFIEPLTERDALEALRPLRPRRTSGIHRD